MRGFRVRCLGRHEITETGREPPCATCDSRDPGDTICNWPVTCASNSVASPPTSLQPSAAERVSTVAGCSPHAMSATSSYRQASEHRVGQSCCIVAIRQRLLAPRDVSAHAKFRSFAQQPHTCQALALDPMERPDGAFACSGRVEVARAPRPSPVRIASHRIASLNLFFARSRFQPFAFVAKARSP